MLSDTEYAQAEGVDPTQFGDDVADFSLFTLPTGEKDTPLWSIKPLPPAEEKADTQKRDLLRGYVRRGYAFDPNAKNNPDGHDSPQEE